ncbi:hypothetical protein H4Q32_019726 [Labeo rohita]|uniref:Uncharacterized protein n=1 Tax=Labeo rohita TaxID=84645 RepID=A0ABQ8LPN1_LABRO|nr:hypothetical protein H4Q32_019726 [Labeo rohita]
MNLPISDFLLFIPFTAGHSQYCYECLTDYCIEKTVILAVQGVKTTALKQQRIQRPVNGCKRLCLKISL